MGECIVKYKELSECSSLYNIQLCSLLLPLVVALEFDNIVDVQPWLHLLRDLTDHGIVLMLTEALVLLGLMRFLFEVFDVEFTHNLALIKVMLILDWPDLARKRELVCVFDLAFFETVLSVYCIWVHKHWLHSSSLLWLERLRFLFLVDWLNDLEQVSDHWYLHIKVLDLNIRVAVYHIDLLAP